MIELLIAFVQSLCLCGYLYGAYVVITHAAGAGTHRDDARRQLARRLEDDDAAAWRRYLAYDS